MIGYEPRGTPANERLSAPVDNLTGILVNQVKARELIREPRGSWAVLRTLKALAHNSRQIFAAYHTKRGSDKIPGEEG